MECAYRKLDPHMLVMQSTQDGAAEYAANGHAGANSIGAFLPEPWRTGLSLMDFGVTPELGASQRCSALIARFAKLSRSDITSITNLSSA